MEFSGKFRGGARGAPFIFTPNIFKTFTLINSAADPGWKGPALHFIIILNYNARRAKEFNFRDCLPSYLKDNMSVCSRHISRTCNYILQGKM